MESVWITSKWVYRTIDGGSDPHSGPRSLVAGHSITSGKKEKVELLYPGGAILLTSLSRPRLAISQN
jgi:hypothetical protein